MDTDMSLHKYFDGKAYFNHRGDVYTSYSGIIDDLLLCEVDKTHKTIAISVLDKDSKSQYLVFDIDSQDINHPSVVRCLTDLNETIQKNGLHSSVISSGNKGFHVYIFIDAPVNAFSLRMIGEYILSTITVHENVIVEIFPKQNTCDYTRNQYGSHLRYPLSKNPKTGVISNFSDGIVENSIEDIINLELFILNKDTINGLIERLKHYFIPGKRHNLMLGLAGYFRNNDYPISMPKYVLSELTKQIKGLDIHDLLRVIEDTYRPDKDRVAGFSILKSMLPYETLKLLESLIYKLNDIKNIISQIRASKLPNFKKIDECASLLTNHLADNFQLYEDNFIYVVDKDDMYSDVNDTMRLLLHKYGISLADTFELSVYKKLMLELALKASKTKLKNFQFFYGGQLHILNSDSTYTISDTINKSGEVYPSFNYKDFTYIPIEKRNTNLRRFFLSWGLRSEDVDIILNYLVFTLVSTEDVVKPILLFQGLPGSGKTTLASCILKLIENVNSQINAPITKEDDFKAVLHSRRCIVLDNLENVPAWFYDLVNSLCTNGEISQRKLYHNNVTIRTKPHVFLIVTSAYADYTDKAFNERCVKIHLPKRNEFKSLQDLMSNFYIEYNSLVSNLLDIIVDIKNVNVSDKYTNRLTDFVKVGRKLYVKKYVEYSWEMGGDDYIAEEILDLIEIMKGFGLRINTPFFLKDFFWKIKFKYEHVIGKTYTLKMFSKDLTTCGKFERLKNGSYKLV